MFEAVNRYRIIESATSTNDDAPPVYLMDELYDLAKTSPDSAESIADHINKRLQHKSPVVKWKALRLIRHICNKGCNHFQKCMQRHAGSVRELVSYRGEKDPFKGDSLNQRVRDMAKEIMSEVLYVSPPQQGFSMSSNARGRTMEGFGNSASGGTAYVQPASTSSYSSQQYNSGGGGGHYSSSSSRMVGFGSDGRSFQPQQSGGPGASSFISQDVTTAVSSAVDGISGMIRSTLSSSYKEHTKSLHQRNDSIEDGGYTEFSNNSASRSGLQTSGVGLGSGRVPGSYGPSSGPSYRSGNSGISGGNGGMSASLSSSLPPPSASAVASALGSEEVIVGDVCAPGGMRAAPEPEDLRKFVEAASSMDGLRIGELLMEKMGSTSTQVLLRALYALEAVLTLGSSQSCGEVAVMFQSDPGPVVRASSASQPAAVRDRASCCLALLLGDEYHPHVQVSSVPPSTSSAHKAQPQLLDLLADDDTPPTHPVAQQSAPMQHTPLDFLGELSGPAPAATPAAFPSGPHQPRDPFGTTPPDVLQISTTSSTQQPQYVQQQTGFGGPTHLNGFGGTSAPPVGQTQGGPSSRPQLDDFFSTMTLSGGAGMQATASSAGMPSMQQYTNHTNHSFPQAPYQQGPGAGLAPVPAGIYGAQNLSVGGGSFTSQMGGFAPAGVHHMTAPSPAAAAPLWSHVQIGQQQQQLKPSKSISDNNAFDFVKDHLR